MSETDKIAARWERRMANGNYAELGIDVADLRAILDERDHFLELLARVNSTYGSKEHYEAVQAALKKARGASWGLADDPVKAERDSLTARCAQLQGIIDAHNLCHDQHGKVGAREFATSCAAEQRKLYGCAPDADLLREVVAAPGCEYLPPPLVERLQTALRESGEAGG